MFFPPFRADLGQRHSIVYTDTDMAKFSPDGIDEVAARSTVAMFDTRLAGLPEDTDFTIAFFWTNGERKFVDLWIQRQFATYGVCGPMTTLLTFDLETGQPVDIWANGNACAWTRIVSGREAEHFAQLVRVQGWSIWEYCDGSRPEMPTGYIEPWPDPS